MKCISGSRTVLSEWGRLKSNVTETHCYSVGKKMILSETCSRAVCRHFDCKGLCQLHDFATDEDLRTEGGGII